jgi:hypothetical protein
VEIPGSFALTEILMEEKMSFFCLSGIDLMATINLNGINDNKNILLFF